MRKYEEIANTPLIKWLEEMNSVHNKIVELKIPSSPAQSHRAELLAELDALRGAVSLYKTVIDYQWSAFSLEYDMAFSSAYEGRNPEERKANSIKHCKQYIMPTEKFCKIFLVDPAQFTKENVRINMIDKYEELKQKKSVTDNIMTLIDKKQEILNRESISEDSPGRLSLPQ